MLQEEQMGEPIASCCGPPYHGPCGETTTRVSAGPQRRTPRDGSDRHPGVRAERRLRSPRPLRSSANMSRANRLRL